MDCQPTIEPLTDAELDAIGNYLPGIITNASRLIWSARDRNRLAAEVERLTAENTALRGLVATVVRPCHYCGVEDMSRCPSGFPGCALADDLLAAQWEGVKRLLAQIAAIREASGPLVAWYESLDPKLADRNQDHVPFFIWFEKTDIRLGDCRKLRDALEGKSNG